MKSAHNPTWLENYDSAFSDCLKLMLFRLTRFIPRSEFGSQKVLIANAHVLGQLVWSGLLKAYRTIYSPGKEPVLWGCVVCSTEADAQTAYQRLPEVVARIRHLLMSDDVQLEGEELEFMRRVTNNQVTMSLVAVPHSISPYIQCIVLDCMLARNGLPDGYLKRGLLPVLAALGAQTEVSYAAALHQKHWNKAFLDEWRQRPDEDIQGDAAPEPTALQVTGLPPDLVDDLEQAVLAACEREGLTASFLHVGFLGQSCGDSATPITPTSDQAGDLVFLGPTEETARVQNQLQLVLRAHLSQEQLAYTSIQTMPLDEFVAAYGWLVDEFANRE